MKYKYRILSLVISVLALLRPIQAMTILPASGTTFAPGTDTAFTITANPPTGNWDEMEIDLKLTGGTITALELAPIDLSPIGSCDGSGAQFLTDNICFTTQFGSFLTAGQLIATFHVHWGAAGTATLVKGPANQYGNAATEQTATDSGTYTFSISSATPTPTVTATPTRTPTPTRTITPTGKLPPTGILEDNRYLILGLVLIGGGSLLYSYTKKNYLFKSQDS